MKEKIAAILISWAVALGGSTEAKPVPLYADEVPETIIVETIETENIETETTIVEDIVPEEYEGEILEVEDLKKERTLKDALEATRVTVADKAVVYWDDVCQTFDDLGNKIIFWD